MHRSGTIARLAVIILAAARVSTPTPAVAQNVPSKLTDSVFWKLVTDVSEPNGYFRSENFVSNETTMQWVIPELLRTTKPGGVYLGVGPDQNFTYVVALKPQIAFIFDIRRQNMLTHLMYKALLESSTDRVDFLSHLFSRSSPKGIDTTSTPEALFIAYAAVPPDSVAFRKNLAAIKERLTKTHGFALSEEDWGGVAYVYQTFVQAGPGINYNTNMNGGGFGRSRMPSYADIQVDTDSLLVHRSYMATEANFRVLKAMEMNNLIVPVVGDFGGPKAIRTVATYLKEHNATVTAFYLSNVEQYLFQDESSWRNFYKNCTTLPLDSSSTFIRSVFNGGGYGYGGMMRAQQMLGSMLEQTKLFNDGKILYYNDIIRTSR